MQQPMFASLMAFWRKPSAVLLCTAVLASSGALAGKQECYSLYDSKSYTAAFIECRDAAEAGDQTAQFNLGYMLEYGLGVPKDHAAALGWYLKAANQGSLAAQNNLGVMYRDGKGTPKDLQKAAEWFQKAADRGNPYALNNLGNMYRNGLGVPQDHEKAVQLYLKAALKDFAAAQNNLGDMYLYGYGVAMSDKEAVYWYQKAANQGLAVAQHNLGNMHLLGRGVDRNQTVATEWFEKAAKQGNKAAQVQLDTLKKQQETPASEGASEDVQVQLVSPRDGSVVKGKILTLTFRLSQPVEGYVPMVLVNGEEVQATPSTLLSGRVSLVTLQVPLPEGATEYTIEVGGSADEQTQIIAAFLQLKSE